MPNPASPRPSDEVEIIARRFDRDGNTPNHPRWPVLLYRAALPGGAEPERVEALLRANGWGGAWTWRVYDYEHHHTRSCEVLAVACGRARLRLGGPNGWELDASAGDVLVLPAGTGHRQLSASDDFAVCGAYPPGQEDPDIVRSAEAAPDAAALARIRAVPRPETDPLYGAGGPLLARWEA